MPSAPNALPHAGLELAALRECVGVHGWAVIEGMPCRDGNGPLLDLANALGRVNPYGAGGETRDGEGVHLVAPSARPVLDTTGKAMLSSTATDFPLHTDECFASEPSRYVLLHCWREDARGGGDSLLANSEAIAARLEPWALDLCHRANFIWRTCRAPIFTRQPGTGWPIVRFNMREIAGDDLGEDADPRSRVLPELMLAAANAAAEQVLLEAGDCLVIDNHRTLHGRIAFDHESKRLLKRVWVKTDPGAAQRETKSRNASTTAAG